MTSRRTGPTAALALVMVSSLLSCQFQRRSAGYDCDSPDDCSGGRVCVDGWCVEGDGGQSVADADPLAPDATVGPDSSFVCPETCSRCDGDTCIMDCPQSDSCATAVVCPPGVKCRVECGGKNSCGGTIDCSAASECLIYCIGNDSCDSLITCG